MKNSITYYEYKNGYLKGLKLSFIEDVILKKRFDGENAQAVKNDSDYTIISKRKI